MAEIEITCPECSNKRNVPADLIGKKLKCKKCQSIFTVKAPPAAKGGIKAGDKPAPAKPPAKAVPVKKDDEEDDKNPYVMLQEDLSSRCPHCALPLDPPDTKICLHCGYHMQARKRVESKKTYETTAADYLLWHLPTVGCFIAIGIIIGFVVFFIMNTDDILDGSFIEGVLPSGCFDTWCVIFALIPIWFSGRFIFRRLVWKFHPQETIKRVEDDE